MSETRQDVDWDQLRKEYEETPGLSIKRLAMKYSLPRGTVERRATVYHWAKFLPVARRATSSITAAANKAIDQTCRAVAARIEERAAQTLKDLAPWIEEQRAVHVRHIVGLSRKALVRLDDLFNQNKPDSPKDEQFSAAAIEKHDTIIRRNLGMSDNGSGSNTLNIGVLVGGGRQVVDAGEAVTVTVAAQDGAGAVAKDEVQIAKDDSHPDQDETESGQNPNR